MKILFQLEQVSESNRKRETNNLAYLLSNEAGKGTRQLQEIQRMEGSGSSRNDQQQLYCLYLRHEDFSTKTITNEKSKIKVK